MCPNGLAQDCPRSCAHIPHFHPFFWHADDVVAFRLCFVMVLPYGRCERAEMPVGNNRSDIGLAKVNHPEIQFRAGAEERHVL